MSDTMEQTMHPDAARAELVDNGWLQTHYGIAVIDLYDPEWGDRPGIVVLGHHSDSRRVIAAMNAFARVRCGEESMLDNNAFDVYPAIHNELKQEWAVLEEATTDTEGCPDYLMGRTIFNATAETINAFPITAWWGW